MKYGISSYILTANIVDSLGLFLSVATGFHVSYHDAKTL